VTKIIEK